MDEKTTDQVTGEEKTTKEQIDYQLERDKTTLKFSVVLVFLGTTVAGLVENMFQSAVSRTASVVAVCVVLLQINRAFRKWVSRRLNRKAEENGDPIPFDEV